MPNPQLVEERISNSELRAYIRENGTPLYTKPDGADHQLVYYPDPDATAAKDEPTKDYAGKPTPPGGRSTISHSVSAGAEVMSTSTSRPVVSGAQPAGPPLDGNPNDVLREQGMGRDKEPLDQTFVGPEVEIAGDSEDSVKDHTHSGVEPVRDAGEKGKIEPVTTPRKPAPPPPPTRTPAPPTKPVKPEEKK